MSHLAGLWHAATRKRHLHEQVTRNHRCADIEELVKLTMASLDKRGAIKIEGQCTSGSRMASEALSVFRRDY